MKKAVLIIVLVFVVLLGYNRIKDYQFEKELSEYKEMSQNLDPSYNSKSESYKTDKQIAVAAQKYVLQALKSPANAEFPSLNYSVVKKSSKDHYTVTSYVDSQNGFGSVVRSNYVVELKVSTNNTLELINISVSN